jgi:hypothetical protein
VNPKSLPALLARPPAICNVAPNFDMLPESAFGLILSKFFLSCDIFLSKSPMSAVNIVLTTLSTLATSPHFLCGALTL